MIHAQNAKSLVILSPGSAIATTATATARVDTLTYEYLTVSVILGTTTNATDNPSVLKFTEGDDTNATDAIASLTGDGASGFTIPDNATAGTATIARFHINLKGRKRYLKLSATPTASGGQVIQAIGELTRANLTPTSATGAGVSALVIV